MANPVTARPNTAKRSKGPIKAFAQKRRLQKKIGQQLLEVRGVERGITQGTSNRELEALRRGGLDEYFADGRRGMAEFNAVVSRRQALERRLQRVNEVKVMSSKSKNGPLQVFMQKRRLKGAIDKQITSEERKGRAALKQVRAETDIWVKPLFENRMPNEAERAAKARYRIVNAEYEARQARIADLEKRRRRIGRGGYGGQPKRA